MNSKECKKVSKIEDVRISNYTERLRSGSMQIFHTGSDARDFDRYRSEGGGSKHGVKMHDKADTIKIEAPEKHLFAELIDGVWWWVNGCDQCNGRARSWVTYIECDTHNVCRACETPRCEIEGSVWGSSAGWICEPCEKIESTKIRRRALEKIADEGFHESDFYGNDEVVCPHCKFKYMPDETPSETEECATCGGDFSIEVEYSVTYSTKVIGERLTPESLENVQGE